MRKPLLAVALLAPIAAAAALLLPSAPRERVDAASAPAQPAPAALPGRIALTPAQVREALAAGLIDHPIKTILDMPARMSYGQFIWNDKGVPAGRAWIRVDLHAQLMSVFRSGHEIGTAVILYGADGLPTPTGRFPILAKLRDHRSVTYDNAPMPYTLRLTRDGVSIHGSNVRWGFATHGCVGIPKDFAAKLFDVVKTGDEVLIVSGKRGTKDAPAA
jgi:lipoprotein-anchoring transpeptidase ErfK/SrfK